MEKEGIVSLWVVASPSLEELEAALDVAYSEDGEFVAPPFARVFGIARFPVEFREAEWLGEDTVFLADLLKGFSYDETIIPRFLEVSGSSLSEAANAVVLLYNFCYEGEVREASVGESRFSYVGSVSYR